MTLKDAIEEAIVGSNYILKRWIESKPSAMNHEMIKALIIHQMKKSVSGYTDWRTARNYFMSKSILLDIDFNEGYLKKMMTITDAYSKTARGLEIESILSSLNYQALNLRAIGRVSPLRHGELHDVSLESLERFTF